MAEEQALIDQVGGVKSEIKGLRKDVKKQHNAMLKHVQEHNAASRAVTLAANERSREQHGERKQESAHTHNQNEKTHEGIDKLKEANAKAAKEREDIKMSITEAEERLSKQLNTAIAVFTSSRKPANPDPINHDDLPSCALTFGADGKAVAVTIADDASTLTSEDAEDADSKVASLKQELAEQERQLKDDRAKIQALTTPSGQVGLSEILPSVTNLTGRARQAETKHVGEKTKRRQQDEQAKAMRRKRYVPAPTRRSTRSTRSSLAEK